MTNNVLDLPFSLLSIVWSLAALFVFISCCLSLYLIYQHLCYYTLPDHQRYIIRILFMVPVYSINSLLSLVFYEQQLYFSLARDCYEAYALYNFFALCVNYVGGYDNLQHQLLASPKIRLPVPLLCVVQPNKTLLKVCRQGILQYVLVKPIVTILSIILHIANLYEEGHFSADTGYFYATIINNICVTISLYCLVIFYQATREDLKPYKPLMKFLCIKIVVFFCFWQSVVIAILVYFALLPELEDLDVGLVATGLNNLLICIEMAIISLMHLYAFPYELYKVNSLSQAPLIHEIEMSSGVIKSAQHAVNQSDVLQDTYNSFVPKFGKKTSVTINELVMKKEPEELKAHEKKKIEKSSMIDNAAPMGEVGADDESNNEKQPDFDKVPLEATLHTDDDVKTDMPRR